MKAIVVAVLIFAAVLVSADDQYTTKYDNVNLQDILRNKRLLKGYANCLLDKGPCSPDGQELKNVLPDALETGCEKCNDKQKGGTKTIIAHLIDHEPNIWKELEAKYDPEGHYVTRYKHVAQKEGISI